MVVFPVPSTFPFPHWEPGDPTPPWTSQCRGRALAPCSSSLAWRSITRLRGREASHQPPPLQRGSSARRRNNLPVGSRMGLWEGIWSLSRCSAPDLLRRATFPQATAVLGRLSARPFLPPAQHGERRTSKACHQGPTVTCFAPWGAQPQEGPQSRPCQRAGTIPSATVPLAAQPPARRLGRTSLGPAVGKDHSSSGFKGDSGGPGGCCISTHPCPRV